MENEVVEKKVIVDLGFIKITSDHLIGGLAGAILMKLIK
jgi:hypothetical protein